MPDLIKQLTSLRQEITPYGAATHKPVLLLAVIDGFRKGFLSSAEVDINMELMTSFHNIWHFQNSSPGSVRSPVLGKRFEN